MALPVEEAPEKGHRAPFEGKVLLVDDEADLRGSIAAMLEHLGFEVIAASDGQEALERFRPGVFTLVLMDLTMPRMDGREAFRRMKDLDPSVRVILSSGYNEQEAIQQFLGRGLAGFIQKPYRTSSPSSRRSKGAAADALSRAQHEERYTRPMYVAVGRLPEDSEGQPTQHRRPRHGLGILRQTPHSHIHGPSIALLQAPGSGRRPQRPFHRLDQGLELVRLLDEACEAPTQELLDGLLFVIAAGEDHPTKGSRSFMRRNASRPSMRGIVRSMSTRRTPWAETLQGVLAIGGGDHLEAEVLQHGGDASTQVRFIIHQHTDGARYPFSGASSTGSATSLALK